MINILTYTFSQKSNHKNNDIAKNYFIIKPELTKKLDAAGQHFVDEGKLSGGVSMIMHQDKVIYQKAFGMQSIEEQQPMQMNSLFRIASMTKPMMTVALLMLVEEGKISLDDKAEKWLPQFATIKVLEQDGSLVTPKTPVTIKHLLMHTSGTRSRADAWFRKNNIDPSKATSLKEYVNILLQVPLINHPGEGFNYAMNNDIVARIIEIITKKNFGAFMKERLFMPLGMNNTWWIVPEKEVNRLTSIYLYKDGKQVLVEGKEPIQSEFPRGNGQLVASAEDYMKFIQLLLNDGVYKGKRLIKKELIDIMTTDMLPKSIPLKVGNTIFPNTGFGLSVAINSGANKEKWLSQPILFENLFQHLPHGSYLYPASPILTGG
ncbi:MAG: beta-lactamase family protein [Saprospiraceae bacterium]|nr:beta-lactamase family protein [Saprospiraceae bacterium]